MRTGAHRSMRMNGLANETNRGGLDLMWPNKVSSHHWLNVRRRGWGLIELLAVLALVSALVLIVAGNVFQRINQASRDSDANSLRNLGQGFESYVVRTRSIPNAAGIDEALGQELAIPAGKVRVSQAGYNRFFLYDPDFRVGTTTNATVPFTQGNGGSLQPVSPRLVLVSSVVKKLPTLATNATTFDELWESTNGIAPASWSGWGSFGDDVRIERVDLRDLFVRLVLSNVDSEQVGRYLFTGTTQLTVASGGRLEAWYVRGTTLDLFFANGLRQGREFLTEDTSYVHEDGQWRRGVLFSQRPRVAGFGALVDEFVAMGFGARTPQFGAANEWVVGEFYSYLWNCAMWSSPDHAFGIGGGTPDQQIPVYRNLTEASARLNDFTYNLIR